MKAFLKILKRPLIDGMENSIIENNILLFKSQANRIIEEFEESMNDKVFSSITDPFSSSVLF